LSRLDRTTLTSPKHTFRPGLLDRRELVSLVFRNVVPPKSRLAYRLSPASPQGLRRLRFSFFLFTCQTTRRSPIVRPPKGFHPVLAAQERDSPKRIGSSRSASYFNEDNRGAAEQHRPRCGGVYSRRLPALSTPRHKKSPLLWRARLRRRRRASRRPPGKPYSRQKSGESGSVGRPASRRLTLGAAEGKFRRRRRQFAPAFSKPSSGRPARS
jgi:hypothetical protein